MPGFLLEIENSIQNLSKKFKKEVWLNKEGKKNATLIDKPLLHHDFENLVGIYPGKIINMQGIKIEHTFQ